MKKILFLFAMLVMGVAGAMAENITSLDQVQADALYTIHCGRGYLTLDQEMTRLYGSNEKTNNVSNALATTFDAENTAFQFKLVEDGGSYYLYSVAADKYVKIGGDNGKTGVLVETTGEADVIGFRSWGTTVQPWWVGESEKHNLNFGGSSQVIIDDWTTKDAGNQFEITKLEIIEYTVVVEGLNGEGGATYKENTYANGDKFTAATANTASIAGIPVDGYSVKVTVNNETKTVTVVYSEPFPNPTKQYIIGNAGGNRDLYIVLAPGDDSQGDSSNATQASFATKAGATPFTFTPSGNGFVLSTVDGETTKYLGADTRWNVNTTQQTAWRLEELEEGVYALNRGDNKYLGSDGLVAGNGLYTDKAIAKNGKWFLEEYVAPAESHNVLVYLDGATEGTKMLPAEEEGAYVATLIGLEAGDHTVSVTYDGGNPVEGSFTSTAKNDKITVHYKDGVVTFENDVVTITLGEAGYATLYSDRDLNFAYSGATVYVLSESEVEGQLHADRVDNAKARTGVIVKGDANTTYEFTHLTNDSEATSLLQGVLVDTPAKGNELVLGIEDEVVGFYTFTGATLAAGKAYYVPASASVSRVLVDFDGTVTALDSIVSAPAANEIFDLQGRRVLNAKNGLYIVNGKKVIK